MGWENRNRRNCYFYLVKRQGMQVVKEYLGRGMAAAIVAAIMLKQKEQRLALQKKRHAFFSNLKAIDSRIRAFLRFSRSMERLQKFIEQNAKEDILETLSRKAEPLSSMTNQLEEPEVLSLSPTIEEILNRAKHGEAQVLPQVCQLIAQKPELWQRMTDLAREAQEAQLHALAGEDPLLKAAVLTKFNALKRELGDGTRSPLEQIVIERILISWLQVQHTDLLLTKTPANDTRLNKHLEKRADQCQGRLLRAVKQFEAMKNVGSVKETKEEKDLSLYATSLATES